MFTGEVLSYTSQQWLLRNPQKAFDKAQDSGDMTECYQWNNDYFSTWILSKDN